MTKRSLLGMLALGALAAACTKEEPKKAEAPAPAAAPGPVDLAMVRSAWQLVVDRVQASSRVVATYLAYGRPVAVEGRVVVVEFPRDARFHAEALGKDARYKKVDAVLEQVLGGGLGIRIVVGEAASAPAGPPVDADDGPPPPVEAPPEVDIDLDADPGEPLDPDADARAVADLALREFGGEVIDQRPNDRAAKERGKR
jgi:hypothetical protein